MASQEFALALSLKRFLTRWIEGCSRFFTHQKLAATAK
jgi:hypothetical protein